MTGKPNSCWPSIAVVGAGAVGGYFGGLLARAGAPVIMIGRPAFVEAVEGKGLIIETEAREIQVSVRASEKISDAAIADIILICVKTIDTAHTAKSLAPLMRSGTRVVSLQNGVDNSERIRAASKIEALSAVVYVAVSSVQPGRIRHLARGDLIVGPEAVEIAKLFARADIPCVVSDNLPVELWTKLATNCALNALSALAHASYGLIVKSAEGRDLVIAIVDEVFAVARAAGIKGASFTQERLRRAAFAGETDAGDNLIHRAQDLQRGKQTEIDSLNGYISERGTELGIPTPANDVLRNLIKFSEQTYAHRNN